MFRLCTYFFLGADIFYVIHPEANSNSHYDWFKFANIFQLIIQTNLDSTITSFSFCGEIRIQLYTDPTLSNGKCYD